MVVLTRGALRQAWRTHRDAESQLKAWYHTVKAARWTNSIEMLEEFPKASVVSDRVVFNIKGNKYRLVCIVLFQNSKRAGRVYVRWFGTHAEYDRINVAEV